MEFAYAIPKIEKGSKVAFIGSSGTGYFFYLYLEKPQLFGYY